MQCPQEDSIALQAMYYVIARLLGYHELQKFEPMATAKSSEISPWTYMAAQPQRCMSFEMLHIVVR